MGVPFTEGAGSLRRATLTPRALLWIGAWAAIAWVVVIWRLGGFGLLDPDEAHYAQLTREIMRANRWLVPLLDGAPYIDKPVLFHWLQAAMVRLIGESELALRIPSACAALALFGVVRWTGSQLFGAHTGNLSALMFATLPMTFALARVGLFDMVFTACLFSAIACLLVAALRDRPALEYAGWPLLTLAVIIKGPVALLLVLLFGAAMIASSKTRIVVARLRCLHGLTFILTAASPWFIYMWLVFGEDFVRQYVFAGNLWYFTAPTTFVTRPNDLAFYFRTFAGAFFPWGVIALGRGVDAFRLWRRGEPLSVEERALWTWILVIMAFFTAAGFKLDTYIFPAAPATAMLAAFGWHQASGRAAGAGASAWTRHAVAAVAVVLIAGGILGSVVLFRIDLRLAAGALVLPAALFGGGAVLALQLRRHREALPRWPVAAVATLICVYASVVEFGLPLLDRSRPTATLGRWIRNRSASDSPVGVLGLSDWRSSIRYYSDRRLVALGGADDVNVFFNEQPRGYVLMRQRDYLTLRAEGSDIRALGGRPAIVGRSGKYIRRQEWGRIVVVRRADAAVLAQASVDTPEGEDVDLSD